jgi:hypothetical protein
MFLVVKPEGNILFIRCRRRWKDNSRDSLKEVFERVRTGRSGSR